MVTGAMRMNAGADTVNSTNALPLVVLTGPPGAGKSSVGRALAERLDAPFADTDVVIEQRAGKPIPEIFVDDGEQAFRAMEREVVAEGLESPEGVLSLGGGAVLAEETQALLERQIVVFLDVSLRFAGRRSGFDQGRPLMALNPRGQWLALMEARRPIYERLATVTVNTDDRTVDQVVESVVAALAAADERFAGLAPAAATETEAGEAEVVDAEIANDGTNPDA